MKGYKKAIFIGVFSFLFCFMTIGFSAISSPIEIKGTVQSKAQTGVFITETSNLTGTNGGTSNIISYVGSSISVDVVLPSKNSVAKSEITVFNSMEETYAYNATIYLESAYSNPNIKYALTNKTNGDVLSHGDTVDSKSFYAFDISFSFADGYNPSGEETLQALLNIDFVPLSEIPEEDEVAVTGVLGQFDSILNNKSNTTDSFNVLLSQMNDYNSNDRANGSYIGNVTGSSVQDVETLESLFEGQLSLNINNVPTEVTVLIKRENLDGDKSTGDENGNEMTIYMTTSDLKSMLSRVTVFASAYTRQDANSEWVQIGEMFEGRARTNGYDGSLFGTGSFNTDTWESYYAYNGIKSGATIEELVNSYK